ncbi:MAG: LPS assembly protein LptD [Burkholderiaceae bacterium]|nr:LPS assembly protein LptD [Burkholderiaceae bacterium]
MLCPGGSTSLVAPGCGRAWPLLPLTAALLAAGGPAWAQWGRPPIGSVPIPAAAPAAAQIPVLPLITDSGIELRLSPKLLPLPRGEAGKQLPIAVLAQKVRGRPDLETIAEGDAVLRRGDLTLQADLLSYDQVEDLALARGNVKINQEGNRYTGPELQLKVQRFEGYFIHPTYYFGRTAAGGKAERIDFIDSQRTVATKATYSSCPADGSGDPDWLLTSDRVKMDFNNNEGIAEGAVLRFLGVPILWAPALSFPLTDERKSGWLPPSVAIDSRSGVRVEVPWYWNIAPNRDATFTPSASLRRGVGLGSEFRYLEENYHGELNLNLLPNDREAGRERYSFGAKHEVAWPDETRLRIQVQRVSDDNYWKDFRRDLNTITPRLQLSDIQATRPFGEWTTYVRAMRWQVLQNAGSLIDAPYERLPQIGARTLQSVGEGFEVEFEGEFNRFANPIGSVNNANRLTGLRAHALASLSWPWVTPGWTLAPKVSVNAASYSLDSPMSDGRKQATRVIPTFSLDSAWVLERDSSWFGKDLRQTLEPRLLYVNTPYRKQSFLPNFDSAPRDFNFESIFTENAFSGVDRVSDSHELTAGVTTRLLDPISGGESMRLGVVQRYLFSDQRVTPQGTTLTQRISDLLLLGSTSVIPNWSLSATMQYSPQLGASVRSTVGAAYSPKPFHTVSAVFRQTRNLSEQLELGWQWPIFGRTPDARNLAGESRGDPASCNGSLYTVGRVNYSTRDSRLVDAILGLEYDAGCWITRVVAERLSTGQAEATTRLLFQLELVGLSRLGSNPLQVLKDNVPGYRLLRDAPASSQNTFSFYD